MMMMKTIKFKGDKYFRGTSFAQIIKINNSNILKKAIWPFLSCFLVVLPCIPSHFKILHRHIIYADHLPLSSVTISLTLTPPTLFTFGCRSFVHRKRHSPNSHSSSRCNMSSYRLHQDTQCNGANSYFLLFWTVDRYFMRATDVEFIILAILLVFLLF